MNYKVELSRQVEKFLLKCDDHVFERFENSVEAMKQNPFDERLDIKKLFGVKNRFRLRVSKYRFLYEIEEDDILIFFYKADKRGDVYKD